MTHFGSGIWSYNRRSTGAIFLVTVPATIIRSDCRGEARKTSAPNRAISKREADAAIISIAQHARPNPIGQIDDSRAQLSTRSMLVVMKLSSNRWSMRPMRTSVSFSALGDVIVAIEVDEPLPLPRRFIEGEDRVHRTRRHARAAIDALVRVNIEHVSGREGRLVFPRVDA